MLELPHYSSQLMQQLWALRNGEVFCDCTVFVGDRPHRAHKLLLAASSMLFRSLLTTSDIVSIDTAVVSSEEFSCLLDMIYTGKLPLGKHNVSRIIAAADNLQMYDVAIGFKKVLSHIVNPQPSPPGHADGVSLQDEIRKDSSDSSTTPVQELSLQKNESIRETKSPTESLETLMDDVSEVEASTEQPNATVLKVLEHSSAIIEMLTKLPAITDLLREASERRLNQQDRQVVMTCCDKEDPGKIGEMLLSHVKKGVLSEMAFICLLKDVQKNNPAISTQLQSILKEFESDIAGPNQPNDTTQRCSEDDDVKEEGTEEEEKNEESLTDNSDDSAPENVPSSSRSSKKKHACSSCKKTFAYKCRLQAHMKRCSRSEKRPLHQCPQCPEQFPTNTALMHHQLHTHKLQVKKKVECEICGRKFAHHSGMVYHMRSEHLEEKPFNCKECGARFAAKSSLKNHMRLHTGEKPYVCTECDMSFTVAAGLAYHIKKKHSHGNMYVCQYCKAEFAQSIELTRHVRTHTGDRPYVCRECGKGYSQANQLTAHLESTHATSESFDCQKCALSFSSRIEHTHHIQNVHPDDFFKCPACEKVFPSASLLNKHKSSHTGLKLFSCDLCNKSYQQLSGLWYHNRTQHAELFSSHTRQLKALVQCDFCFKFFPSEETLAQHQAIEHQGSSLKCPLCPDVFVGLDRMQSHITTHHADQRETICMHCFEVYGSVSELQEHTLAQHPETQETLTGEVPDKAPDDTVDDAEQMTAADCLLQGTTSTDIVLSETQPNLENAQQVFVALANGQEGAQVVGMYDVLNNSVTFICEKTVPDTTTQP